jgi:hypothetical protein
VVRNAIDLAAWGPAEDVTDGPVLGWTGWVPRRRMDLAVLRGWLGPFLEAHDLRIVHAGHDGQGSFAELTGVDPQRVETRPVHWFGNEWSSWRPLAGVDIGIVPLGDSALARGRSCLKGMEFAACGIPFVASPHDEYRWLGAGLMAGTALDDQPPSAWIAALEQLLDPAERVRVASEQSERLKAEDIAVRGRDWERLYQGAPRAAPQPRIFPQCARQRLSRPRGIACQEAARDPLKASWRRRLSRFARIV